MTNRTASDIDAAGATVRSPEDIRAEQERGRAICDLLRLHRLCGRARCRRTQRCAGDPAQCFDEHAGPVPSEAHAYALALIEARRLNAIRAGSGNTWLRDQHSREALAWRCWVAGIDAGRA